MESEAAVVAVLRSDHEYVQSVAVVFGIAKEQITLEHLEQALAAFERTLITGQSAIDKYLYGRERTALSDQARRGLLLFRQQLQTKIVSQYAAAGGRRQHE